MTLGLVAARDCPDRTQRYDQWIGREVVDGTRVGRRPNLAGIPVTLSVVAALASSHLQLIVSCSAKVE